MSLRNYAGKEKEIIVREFDDGGFQIECIYCQRIICCFDRIKSESKFELVGSAVMDHSCNRKI